MISLFLMFTLFLCSPQKLQGNYLCALSENAAAILPVILWELLQVVLLSIQSFNWSSPSQEMQT